MIRFLSILGLSTALCSTALADTTIRSNWSAASSTETSIINASGTPDNPNRNFTPRAFVTEICYDRGEPASVNVHIDSKSATSVLAKNACIILQGKYDVTIETDKIYTDGAAPAGHLQFILPRPVVGQKKTKTITRRLLDKAKIPDLKPQD